MFRKIRQMFREKKLYRKHEEESFNARLEMEKKAQEEMVARLKTLELTFKNQGRIR